MKPYPKRVKYLDPKEAEKAVAEVTARAREADVKIALVGGLAMQFYGSDRLTTDVDFVAEREEDLGLLEMGALGSGGYYGKTSSGVLVDIIVRNDDFVRLYEDACRLAQEVDGGGVYVVPPEYLAVMKFEAWRPKDELDLDFLIRSDILNLEVVEKYVKRYLGAHSVKLFKRFVSESRWLASEEKK